MKKLVLIAAMFVTTLTAFGEIKATGTITIIDPSGKTITVTNGSNGASVTVNKAESVAVVAGEQIIYVETGTTTGEYVETIN